MATVGVLDVAAYILKKYKKNTLTAMKLQKLVYYCQAWSLVWDDKPLFREDVEAWANGPVVRKLFESHRGQYFVNDISKGDATKLNKNQIETIEAILKYYGNKDSFWLSNLTHTEDPWRNARKGIPDSSRGFNIISHADMAEYYSSL